MRSLELAVGVTSIVWSVIALPLMSRSISETNLKSV